MRLLAVILLLLAGCVSIEDRIAKAAPTCEKMGYEVGSDAFRNCQLSIAQTEQQRHSAAGAAAFQGRPKTCLPTNGGMTCF